MVADVLRTQWQARPWWMNLILGFCLYMTFVYMPFDLFWKPVADDEEVWFGVTLHGWAAKATAPLHWLIYAAGAYGFWTMRRWMWPWASVYAAQVSLGMLIWNGIDPSGAGWPAGALAGLLFAVPAVALWRARDVFSRGRGPGTEALA